MRVAEVRAIDHKGRHTTTRRTLVFLSCGGYLIDNPGMREIQLWTDEQSLRESFRDIDELPPGHMLIAEPGRTVIAAHPLVFASRLLISTRSAARLA